MASPVQPGGGGGCCGASIELLCYLLLPKPYLVHLSPVCQLYFLWFRSGAVFQRHLVQVVLLLGDADTHHIIHLPRATAARDSSLLFASHELDAAMARCTWPTTSRAPQMLTTSPQQCLVAVDPACVRTRRTRLLPIRYTFSSKSWLASSDAEPSTFLSRRVCGSLKCRGNKLLDELKMRSQQRSGWRRPAHGCQGVKVKCSALELYRLQAGPQV